jgi:hypothetical protein
MQEESNSEMSAAEVRNHRFSARFAQAEGPDAKIESWLAELDESEGQTKRLKELLSVTLAEI